MNVQEPELRAIANEVWSNAATIDGLMRCLDPIIQDVAIEESRNGYYEGLEDSVQVINTHRMRGYICSCGAEINSMEGHYEQQIRALKEGHEATERDHQEGVSQEAPS